MTATNPESAVKERYAAAAVLTEAALCCAVEYPRQYLEVIPEEVIQKDYGCGDPSRHLQPGETVLDLGSGAGKTCFIAAQIVGSAGKVIGIDMTDEMLDVARRNAPIVAGRLGYANVAFRKGRIQDLALDLDRLDRELAKHPITSAAAFLAADKSKWQLFTEIHRVLRNGGRAVISDIVSDKPVPDHLQRDAQLWSGCLSGALTEGGFLKAFADAGFVGIRSLARTERPWRVVEGIEFRSLTVVAYKAGPVGLDPVSAPAGPCCGGSGCC